MGVPVVEFIAKLMVLSCSVRLVPLQPSLSYVHFGVFSTRHPEQAGSSFSVTSPVIPFLIWDS
jgi:hypothetical protein